MARTDKHAPTGGHDPKDPTVHGGAHPGGSVDDRYERSDARTTSILATGLFLFGAAVATAFAMKYYYKFSVEAMKGRDFAATAMPVPSHGEPQFAGPANLQISPKLDMDTYRAASLKTLSSYDWVTTQPEVVRIPVSRAMALLAERGLPARPAAEAAGFSDEGTSAPQDSSAGRSFRYKLR